MIFLTIVYILCVAFIINKYHRDNLTLQTVLTVAVLLPIAFVLMIVFFFATLAATKFPLAKQLADKIETMLNKIELKVKGE